MSSSLYVVAYKIFTVIFIHPVYVPPLSFDILLSCHSISYFHCIPSILIS